ncbi:MAG: PH domain-containing protein [Candidatus Saccharimonadales bacterium]
MNKRVDKRLQDFDGQREGEELLFVFRRHLIAMRKGFWLLFIPFVISSLPVFIWQTVIEVYWSPLVGLIIGLILFYYHFLMWYYTVYIVTNQRLRQVTQKGFFGKDVIDLGLSKVQSISYNVPGFSGEILGFGTIVVQTLVGDLTINKVEHPEDIYNKLQDAVAAVEHKQELNEKITST